MKSKQWIIAVMVSGATIGACAAEPRRDASDDDGGPPAGADDDGETATAACYGVGFAPEATTWSLPSYGVDESGNPMLEEIGDERSCAGGGSLRYQVFDLDGDAEADLVVSDNCLTDPATGVSQWRMHPNTGAGFAEEPISWGLPDYGVDVAGEAMLERVGDERSCLDDGALRYQVVDLDGDGKPDLVVSDNCLADAATGAIQWRMHPNTGAGFAAEPIPWSLPDYGVDAAGEAMFERVGDERDCLGGGALRYQVVDLDGDGKPDLVVSDHCLGEPATGASQWRVHLNTGSGFASAPTFWSLPDYGVDDAGEAMLERMADEVSCLDGGAVRYQVVDLDGDGKPDLVVSDNCLGDPATGATEWRVHLNTGSGFAIEATSWTLPDYGVDASGASIFDELAGSPSCPAGGALRFGLLELGDDAKPELVVTAHCDADTATGQTRWMVHDNTGSGFVLEPRFWTLPGYGVDAGGEPVLEAVAASSSCPGGGTLRHQLVRLAGKGATNLVVSDHCAADEATGLSQWRVHSTLCQ